MSRITKVVVTGPATRVEVDGAPLQTIVHGEQQLNLVNVGPPGPPGAAVTVHLLGTLDDPSELPTPGSVGDGWLIDGDVWVWTAEGEWINAGRIQGPEGPEGPPGPTEPYVQLGSNLSTPHHLGQLPATPGGLNAADILHIARAITSGNPAAGVRSYSATAQEVSNFTFGQIPVTENANGISMRFPGAGIQVCAFRIALPSLAAGTQTTYTWTYPEEFSEDPSVFVLSGTGSTNAYRQVAFNHNAAGTATAEFAIRDTRSSGGSVSLSISVLAFGKF